MRVVFKTLNPLVDIAYYTDDFILMYADKSQTEGSTLYRPHPNWALIREHHVLSIILGIDSL